jgi:hypothetical protein
MSFARLGFVPVLGLLPLLSSGCSDPVPATPRGAIMVRVVDSGADCSVIGHEGRIGSVSGTDHLRVLVDGEEGADITCRVAGAGPFAVTATASQATTEHVYGFSMAIPSIAASATVDAPATGGITFASEDTGGDSLTSDNNNPCLFYFNAAAGQSVSAGKIWVSFNCPAMLLDTSTCPINEGHAIFENCETE